jgi:aminoglycoside 2'-N-acetyltransferase I
MPRFLEIIPGEALDGGVRTQIIRLCELAYQEDFSKLFEQFSESIHVMARDECGVLLSHAEFVPRWLHPAGLPVLRTAYVEAVATAPDARRSGLATAVLQRLAEAVAADTTWELAALSPSDAAFYERRGWELWRGPLAIRRDRHLEPSPEDEQVMIRRLPRTPVTIDTTVLLTAEWREGELW